MKLTAIVGSPKGMNGYTGSLVKPVLEAAQEAGAETMTCSLGELTVNFCKGCTEVCHKTGVCHQKDDLETVLRAMLEADAILFATPNYNYSVSAQLKALLDRCNFPLHCQKFSGKYAATVVTSGGSDPEAVGNYLSSILTTFGFRMVGAVNGVELQLEDPEERADLTKHAAALGRRIVEAVKNQEVFEELEEERTQAFEIIGFLVQTKKDTWPLAYQYWVEHWGAEAFM